MDRNRERLVPRARRLEYFTIAYNSLEGLISMGAGLIAGSISLIGFGLDSLIEVTSGAALLWRLHRDLDAYRRKRVEQISLKIVGWCFVALALYIAYESCSTLIRRESPDRSIPGIALAVVSLISMPLLARAKRRVAADLGSDAMKADSRQADFRTYLSAILLCGLLLNALLGWWWANPSAGLVMVPIWQPSADCGINATCVHSMIGTIMIKLSRRSFLGSMIVLPVVADDGWMPLFDGKSLDGWRASENAGTWSAKVGFLESNGPRSHLFYEGRVQNADFKNFELKAEVMSQPGANSGIFFHTAFQSQGWPEKGFEVQVCNTCQGEGDYRERKKTGSLYGVRNVYKAFAKDGEWFQLHIAVRGKNVQVRLNGTLLVDYVEPDQPVRVSKMQEHTLGRGTFALQGHDAGSRVRFRNILVRPLEDDLSSPRGEKPVMDEVYRKLLRVSDQNFPVVDYHVHLKGGWTLEEALAESRRTGIQYGIAVNCGVGFPITDDNGIREFLRTMAGQPVFVAMQAEGREWVKMFSPEAIAKFDYVFTDAMTFTDDRGKRMRLWIKEEVGEIDDRQRFMDVIVARILGVLDREPIDIYVNPTFLPEVMAADYDALWTPERMGRVIEAAKRNNVAIEINNRYRIPSARFIKMAKQAGVKFSFGTNNTDRNLGRLEYCLEMVDACGLAWQDIFVPRADGEKPIQKRKL